jgi:hypothetical protein
VIDVCGVELATMLFIVREHAVPGIGAGYDGLGIALLLFVMIRPSAG